MFYVISKWFFAIARPTHFLLILLVVGCLAALFGRRRLATVLIGFVTLSLVGLSFTPAAFWAIQPLEARFPRPDLLSPPPDGIIVLGGAFDTRAEAGHGDSISLNEAAERVTEIPRLAKLYPDARIVYTGGTDVELPKDVIPEAQGAQRLLVEAGIAPERITIEDKSLTTWENAILTKEIVKPADGSRWLLVTSAFHMPRSVGVFRKAGWPGIIAYPTDYRAPSQTAAVPWRLLAVDNLALVEYATKEYFGLVGYYLAGRTDSLFPAP
ncbi:MAG: YdcF family protein [Ancalomicrobiaceae bacterium]|nr:YdcF family protein [Ancalomicrobiaceae bacterium]